MRKKEITILTLMLMAIMVISIFKIGEYYTESYENEKMYEVVKENVIQDEENNKTKKKKKWTN